MIKADKLKPIEVYPKEENKHPKAIWDIKDAKVTRNGKKVEVLAVAVRSSFEPGLIEVNQGDLVTIYMTNNARAETVDQKPAYRGPFRYRRCLIPTEGFYEWKPERGGKQPYLIRMRSGVPFALAGLWDHWQDPNGSELETCTILVTDANALIAPIHERMPVIRPPAVWDTWLDPHQQDTRALRSLLVPSDPAPLEAYPVSRAVNNTRNDEPILIEPV